MTNWKEIHNGFTKAWLSGKNYKQRWEEGGFTKQDAREWISAGFVPKEYHWVKQWKDHDFTPRITKDWINIGLTKSDYKFAIYLRGKNYQPHSYLIEHVEQLRKDFDVQKERERLVQYQQQFK